MASALYDGARAAFLRAEIHWATADIRALLLKSTYSFSAAHEFVGDVVAHELTAGGYSRQSITGRSVGTSAPTYALAANPTFGTIAVGETIGAVVLYVHNASDAAARLVVFCDNPDQPTPGQVTVAEFENSRVFQWGG